MNSTTTSRSIRYDDPLNVLLAMQRQVGEQNAFLLESLSGPDADTRTSIVGATGVLELRVTDGRVEFTGLEPAIEACRSVLVAERIIESGAVGDRLVDGDGLWRLPEVLQRILFPDDVPAANIGLLAYYGYEAVRYAERLPRPAHHAAPTEPDAVFSVVHASVTMPSGSSIGYVAATSTSMWAPLDLAAFCRDLEERASVVDGRPLPAPTSVSDDTSFDEYSRRVEVALEHIRAGDIYQIQLGHEITVETAATPMQVYRRMREHNPSPYMSYLPMAGSTITGASPELFVRVQQDRVATRPIAGTARRTGSAPEDASAVAVLSASEKERAEHLMLVDLCRNDLGRVASTDSTTTQGLMTVEQYSHVFHLVTTVACRVEPGHSISDIVRASFPAGTMTGAPKVRAMELIDELETAPRGFYAGAFGIIDRHGDAVLGLAIRMAVHRGGSARIRASAGIVADSTAHDEWHETIAKMGAAYFAVTGEELR
ncbi:anthranilate synthase component I family protein [Curtobacterium sp. B8]|uniref:anthranilate synthase component I family protein n=1 Tax=Curtobacterium sp. B8 TaxID=95611 RepID=UPI00034D260D|nr:anthranilate synthase component I family protein [Curtobacterium sp. B8]